MGGGTGVQATTSVRSGIIRHKRQVLCVVVYICRHLEKNRMQWVLITVKLLRMYTHND